METERKNVPTKKTSTKTKLNKQKTVGKCVLLHKQFVIVIQKTEGCPRGVMVKAMDCRIVVREFVLQSDYYIHFQANTLGKGMNPLILPVMG